MDVMYLTPWNFWSNSFNGGVLALSGIVTLLIFRASTQILGALPPRGTIVS
jgi:hypothetical protein